MVAEIVEIGKILIAIVPASFVIYQKLKTIFQKHEVAIVTSEDIDTLAKLREAVGIIRSDENLQEIPELKKLLDVWDDFFKNNFWGYVNDQPVVVPRKYSMGGVAKRIGISRKESVTNKITLIPRPEFKEFKEKPILASKSEREVIASVPLPQRSEYTSLLALSMFVEELYNKGDINLAEKTKLGIKDQYGNFGLKFCNSYLHGYLKKLFNFLGDKDSKTIQTQLHNFFQDAKYIFFVHRSMRLTDFEEVKALIRLAFDNSRDYIALHSLGTAVELLKIITKDIKAPSEYHYEFLEGRDPKRDIEHFSIIWHKGNRGTFIRGLLS